MRDFRIAVGRSLKGKVGEHGFYLQKIGETTKTIEQKHAKQDYPINAEIDQLNYFFSAYLNTIQTLKDVCAIATGVPFSWCDLSPTYGKFISYCRNAATHDGTPLINSGKGIKNYITGPLSRRDGNEDVQKFDPPNEDVLTLCWNISTDVLASISDLLKREGCRIPIAKEADCVSAYEASLTSDFVPDEFKNMLHANKENIRASFRGVKNDVIPQALGAIASVEKFITDARS